MVLSCKLGLNHNSNKEVAMISVIFAKKAFMLRILKGLWKKKKTKIKSSL